MIVLNAQRTTAIVIRHDGHSVILVPMKSGRLSALRVRRNQYEADWREHDYPLDKALAAFIDHAEQQGATQLARKGLHALAARNRQVIRPLF